MLIREIELTAQQLADKTEPVNSHGSADEHDHDHHKNQQINGVSQTGEDHLHADEDEDEAVDQEGDVFPEIGQHHTGGGGHVAAAAVADEHARKHHRQHAAEMKLLGQQISAIRHDGAEGDLDEMIVHPGEDEIGYDASNDADGDAAGRHYNELGQSMHPVQMELSTANQHRSHHDVEDDDGRGVIEHALTFNQRREPFGRAQRLEQGHHCHRIGGGDE